MIRRLSYLLHQSIHPFIQLTYTSVPRSFILAKASSLKFPCSTPDVTNGIGISRCTRYTLVHGGTKAKIRATRSTRTEGG